MNPDLWRVYGHMLRSRRFEEAVSGLWAEGRILGEMHLGIGEEAIAAGVVLQLKPDDAMALDHRGTPPLLMAGVDPTMLLRELLGRPDGLCGGMGGHMHLYWPERLIASSGIVGASGPATLGFALAADYLRPGTVAVGFFGEGAANQGAVLEAMNLAGTWRLPAVFVCKDNQWAITTRSASVTSGPLTERASAMSVNALSVDGSDVMAVWAAAETAIGRARSGKGPTFLLCRCARPHGHFLGDPVLRMARNPLAGLGERGGGVLRSISARRGAPLAQRWSSLKTLMRTISAAAMSNPPALDPVARVRATLLLEKERLLRLESEIEAEVARWVEVALRPSESTGGGQ